MQQQKELHEMMIRLEESKNLEAEERARLEEEINSKRSEVEEIVSEVQRKEEENRQLQQEMEEARRRQDEASQALIAASTTPKHHHLQVGLKTSHLCQYYEKQVKSATKVAQYWKHFPKEERAGRQQGFRTSKVLLEV